MLPDNITTWDDYTARQAAREIGEDLSVHLAGSIKPVRARKRRPVGELKESSLAGLLMQDSPGWHATRPPLAGREHPRTDATGGADGCEAEGAVTAVEISEMRAGAMSATSMPGEVLSPSQASTFLSCQARWYFRYMAGLPDPPAGGAVRGKAVHKRENRGRPARDRRF